MTAAAPATAPAGVILVPSRGDAPALRLVVRPLRPGDRERYVRAVGRLSDRTTQLRFGTIKRQLTPREVERMLDVGHDGAEALAALDADGEILAIARYAPYPDDPGVADVAIVVGDPVQGRGIGSQLLGRLLPLAWAAGYTRLTATTLAENHAVHGLLLRHGFRPVSTSWGVREFEAVA